MKQAPANDKRDWWIRGPDDDGIVWFVWEGEGPKQMFNLGSLADAGEGFADWLAQQDYGER